MANVNSLVSSDPGSGPRGRLARPAARAGDDDDFPLDVIAHKLACYPTITPGRRSSVVVRIHPLSG